MRTKIPTLLAAAFLLAVLALPSSSATLAGTSVTGSLAFGSDPSNYFDPGYGFVPTGNYLNAVGTTVVISNAAYEFGFDDGGSLISANFSDSALSVSDTIESSAVASAFRMTFTDVAFAGQSFRIVSGNFPLADYSLVGNVIRLDFAGGSVTAGQTFTTQFGVTPVPEPATLLLVLILGPAALALCRHAELHATWSRPLRGTKS